MTPTPEEMQELAAMAPAVQRGIADFLDVVLLRGRVEGLSEIEEGLPEWLGEDDERLAAAFGAGVGLYWQVIRKFDCRHQSVGEMVMRLADLRDTIRANL